MINLQRCFYIGFKLAPGSIQISGFKHHFVFFRVVRFDITQIVFAGFVIPKAIYELFRGELDMVDDLRLIMKTYRDSMRSLSMLSEQEMETIFGRLEDLQPLHQGRR